MKDIEDIREQVDELLYEIGWSIDRLKDHKDQVENLMSLVEEVIEGEE